MTTNNYRNSTGFGSDRSMADSPQDRNGPVQQQKGMSSLPNTAMFAAAMGGLNRRSGNVRVARSYGKSETLLVGLLAHPRCSKLFRQLLDRAPHVDEKLAERVQLISVGDPRWTEPKGGEYVESLGLSAEDMERDWASAVSAAGGADTAITRAVHEIAKLVVDDELRLPCLVLQLRERPVEVPLVLQLPEQVNDSSGMSSQVLESVVAYLSSTPLRAQLNNAISQDEENSRRLIANARTGLESAIAKVIKGSGWIMPRERLSEVQVRIFAYLVSQNGPCPMPQIDKALELKGKLRTRDLGKLKSCDFIDNKRRIGFFATQHGRESLDQYVRPVR